MIHVYDPKENVIFLEEDVEFSWYNNMNLTETGNLIQFFLKEKCQVI